MINIMKYSLLFSFVVCCFLLPTAVFAEDQDETVGAVAEESQQEDEFVYSPIGLRDPFAPLVKEVRQVVSKPRRNLGPLEKFELSQFRLLAMLIVKGTPRAMVKAPDGKSYTVKIGDLIGPNGGVVKRIETKTVELDKLSGQRIVKSPDRLVVEETGVDSYSGKEFKEERYIEM